MPIVKSGRASLITKLNLVVCLLILFTFIGLSAWDYISFSREWTMKAVNAIVVIFNKGAKFKPNEIRTWCMIAGGYFLVLLLYCIFPCAILSHSRHTSGLGEGHEDPYSLTDEQYTPQNASKANETLEYEKVAQPIEEINEMSREKFIINLENKAKALGTNYVYSHQHMGEHVPISEIDTTISPEDKPTEDLAEDDFDTDDWNDDHTLRKGEDNDTDAQQETEDVDTQAEVEHMQTKTEATDAQTEVEDTQAEVEDTEQETEDMQAQTEDTQEETQYIQEDDDDDILPDEEERPRTIIPPKSSETHRVYPPQQTATHHVYPPQTVIHRHVYSPQPVAPQHVYQAPVPVLYRRLEEAPHGVKRYIHANIGQPLLYASAPRNISYENHEKVNRMTRIPIQNHDYAEDKRNHHYVEEDHKHDYVEEAHKHDYVEEVHKHDYVEEAHKHDYQNHDYVEEDHKHDYQDHDYVEEDISYQKRPIFQHEDFTTENFSNYQIIADKYEAYKNGEISLEDFLDIKRRILGK